MPAQVINFECPNCGATVDFSKKICDYCHNPVTISTFRTIDEIQTPRLGAYAMAYERCWQNQNQDADFNKSRAFCYLKMKNYQKALPAFEEAIAADFSDSEAYFYAAACLFGGKKAFVAVRPVIDKALEYLDAAVSLEPRGIYYYFMAYIKYDYFSRKFLNTSPDYRQLLRTARTAGYSDYDVQQLYRILNTERPSVL